MRAHLKKYFQWYLLLSLAVVAFFIWQAVWYFESRRGQASIDFFDVGQGDAIFLEASNGNQVLIDGGPGQGLLAKLGRRLPFWDRSIDLLILTHPHADHLDGLLEVLTRYRVGMVLETGVNHSIPEYQIWHDVIREKEIPLVIASRGQILRIANGLTLRVLTPFHSFVNASPKNIHDAAIVLKFAYASSTALLMADAEAPLEYQLVSVKDDLRAEILKVGHHGSKTSSSALLLSAVKPRYAVISVGRNNRYGHPHQEVLDRLVASGITVYRTDRNGDIIASSDGHDFAITSALDGGP